MEKYDYLRQYSAPNVINRLKTIPLSEEFYETAINRLKDEFGSQEEVMAHFTERLLNIPSITSRFDLDGLQSLVQLVQSSMAALRTSGLSEEHVAPFFCPVLKRALPVELYLDFKNSCRTAQNDSVDHNESRMSTATSTTMDDLRAMIDYLAAVCDDMSALDPGQRPQDRQLHRTPTLAAMAVTAKGNPRKKPEDVEASCLFCADERHVTEKCSKEMTIEERQAKLSQAKRCFRCTGSGHWSRHCPTSMLCDNCQRRNHVSVMCRKPVKTLGVHCCQSDSTTATSKSYYMTVRAFAVGPKG